MGQGEGDDVGVVQLPTKVMHLLEAAEGRRELQAVEGHLAKHLVRIGQQLQGGGAEAASPLTDGGLQAAGDLG